MLNIIQRQMNLKFLNFYKGQVDGIEGKLTKQAYKDFQKEFNLEVDGIYGVKTDSKLIETIKTIQRKTNAKIDGIAGNETINKCKEYQNAKGIAVDGICGKITRAKLNETSALSWDKIKYFKKEEFACPCCGYNVIDIELVKKLDEIREYYNKPLIITSGCRCQKHNDELPNSSKNSRHITGKAADIRVEGISVKDLLIYTQTLVKAGILRYTYTNNTNMQGAVHVDIN